MKHETIYPAYHPGGCLPTVEAAQEVGVMPKSLEMRLRREARAKHYGKERQDRYVYGTLQKMGYGTGKRRKHRRRGRKS